MTKEIIELNRLEQIRQAAAFISSKIDVQPQFGIIPGSGQGAFADELASGVRIPFKDIPHFPVPTVQGHGGNMVIGRFQDIPVLALQGRFHYYEGYTMDQVVFPVRCMQALGISNLIVTNAAGSVNPIFKPGDLMLIKDHIKFHGDSPLRGPNLDAFGPRFNDMSDPYTEKIRVLVKECAGRLGIPLQEGVYYYVTGPSYETAGEVRAIRILGADAVGMSTIPEVIAACHGGMTVLGISCITNMATGILDRKINHEEVIRNSSRAGDKLSALLKQILSQWAGTYPPEPLKSFYQDSSSSKG